MLRAKKFNVKGDSVTTHHWQEMAMSHVQRLGTCRKIKEWLVEVDFIDYTHIYHGDNAPTNDLAEQGSRAAVINYTEATMDVRFRKLVNPDNSGFTFGRGG